MTHQNVHGDGMKRPNQTLTETDGHLIWFVKIPAY